MDERSGSGSHHHHHRLLIVLVMVLLFGVIMIQYVCPSSSECQMLHQLGSWFKDGGAAGSEIQDGLLRDPYIAEDGALVRFVPRFNFSETDLNRVVDFNIKGDDVIVFLHIQKTGGTTFGRHLVRNIKLERPCDCHAGQKKCTCYRPGKKETWLFSRFSTGWSCGLHADWTELTSCVPSRMDSVEVPENLFRNYYYITILRDPVSRYLSEWRHVQRGATWKASLHVCDGRSPTLSELPSCYSGDDWSGCSLQEFMDCPYNLANNRQTRMLADLSLVGCYNVSAMGEEARWAVLLESAKRNLRSMAFFGLTEYQRKTQYLFERTFNLEFITPFTQANGTRASGVEVPPKTQQRILQLNQWDLELYEYARDLFLQRFQAARQKERRQARERRQQERRRLRGRFTAKQWGQQKPTEITRHPDRHWGVAEEQQWRKDGDDGESEILLPDLWDQDENTTMDDYMDNVEQW
ncbi:heparan-sulfate 6-O-sulfotransferase 2 isoform X2 [Takifugu rubripes]|uniref:heparan-sulfate 6-O-sulfotransferase 2 isoform X2 n=1 Tax=Takifugu rubripes TaxID=31033 RepID=UPI0005D28F5E|nr:heparan-sulfate 6-O-sulfotransferase 2-like isoform X2 [Takifugu rubripes]XP_056898376.1 heparan-sulfate 6-O-sulfotransferase 2 isoform X2 [Takifugu flavidus]|eukprot:XP_011608795.1 PREDICTED: heparan-sulfate 6-O-sulfotransferase 2-like isoform X2 [Takifugu rubripes]